LCPLSRTHFFITNANPACSCVYICKFQFRPIHPPSRRLSTFKLNWASASTGDKRGDSGSDHTIFVGDLAHGVTDSMLEDVFKAKYPSVRGANVVVDMIERELGLHLVPK
jgi:RNA recognition motif-containing protein